MTTTQASTIRAYTHPEHHTLSPVDPCRTSPRPRIWLASCPGTARRRFQGETRTVPIAHREEWQADVHKWSWFWFLFWSAADRDSAITSKPGITQLSFFVVHLLTVAREQDIDVAHTLDVLVSDLESISPLHSPLSLRYRVSLHLSGATNIVYNQPNFAVQLYEHKPRRIWKLNGHRSEVAHTVNTPPKRMATGY
jgi:hypothetical protein